MGYLSHHAVFACRTKYIEHLADCGTRMRRAPATARWTRRRRQLRVRPRACAPLLATAVFHGWCQFQTIAAILFARSNPAFHSAMCPWPTQEQRTACQALPQQTIVGPFDLHSMCVPVLHVLVSPLGSCDTGLPR